VTLHMHNPLCGINKETAIDYPINDLCQN